MESKSNDRSQRRTSAVPHNCRRRAAASVMLASLIGMALAGFNRDCPAEPTGPERWESAMKAFDETDAKSPPVKHGIVFVGSSSIRRWDVAKSFPDRRILNRGFGGSQIADSVHHLDRVVLRYEPRVVVMYAGDNDIASGKSPEQVLKDFVEFVEKTHESLPETRIVFIGIKPSIKRWALVGKVRDANRQIASMIEKNERLRFVDVDAPMIGDDGQPRAELFVEDGLHLSETGYELWTKLVRPHLSTE